MAGASIAAPSTRSGAKLVLAGAAAFVLLISVLGALAAQELTTGESQPSAAAIADIPTTYLALYEREGLRFGVDWAVLAAIGKVECDHGRSQAPGCNPPGTMNAAGATGPMQFLGSTWRAGTPPMTVPQPGPTARDGAGYATDGDGDGIANVWDPADAIAGAARLLRRTARRRTTARRSSRTTIRPPTSTRFLRRRRSTAAHSLRVRQAVRFVRLRGLCRTSGASAATARARRPTGGAQSRTCRVASPLGGRVTARCSRAGRWRRRGSTSA